MTKKRQPTVDPVADVVAAAEATAAEKARAAAERDGPDLRASDADVERWATADVLVVTGALNASPLAEREWATLQRYVAERSKTARAELLVVPLRYRNPTSPGEARRSRSDVWWWAPEVMPHLAENRIGFHRHLYVMADARINATNASPLARVATITRAASAVFGHAQVAMDTVPTPQSELPKLLHTTGAITRPRYSESLAGLVADFHHSLGAVVIERDDDVFHLRKLTFDAEGGFYDLDRYYHPRGSRRAERALALVTGDTHLRYADRDAYAATFGPDGMIARLRPEEVYFHDLLDFGTDSHHAGPVERAVLGRHDLDLVQREFEEVMEFLQGLPKTYRKRVVASNHHEHAARWVRERDWRTLNPKNAAFYLELAHALVTGSELGAGGVEELDPLEWFARSRGVDPEDIAFLKRGESSRRGGIELGFHGDVGPSGARGTMRNLDRMGTRLMTGHGHGPGIFRGHARVGVLSVIDRAYTRGSASNWLATNGAIYPNGKYQLINVVRGRFCRGA